MPVELTLSIVSLGIENSIVLPMPIELGRDLHRL